MALVKCPPVFVLVECPACGSAVVVSSVPARRLDDFEADPGVHSHGKQILNSLSLASSQQADAGSFIE
jgi:hypothetical protein